MNECEKCKDIDDRITKWIDHVGCTPLKFQRIEEYPNEKVDREIDIPF